MVLTIDLPAEVVQRLEAEATRRGITVDELVAELTAALPGAGAGSSAPRKILGRANLSLHDLPPADRITQRLDRLPSRTQDRDIGLGL